MKYLHLLLLIFSTSFMSAQQKTDEVIAIASVPAIVTAGDSFEITITIVKPNLKHYGEFRQILPKGFTPYEKKSGSADFKFVDQQISYIWLRLPSHQRFSVTYGVVVDSAFIGNYSLQGQFIYVYNNQRGSIDVPSKPITVTRAMQFNRSASAFEPNKYQFPPKDPKTIQVLRKRSTTTPIIVTLQVSIGSINGGAKIEEKIPPGYKAELVDGKGSNFTFFGQNAEFLWSNLPQTKNFEIAYKLVPTTKNIVNTPMLSGEFMYVENDNVKKIPVIETTQEKVNKKSENQNEIINFFNN